MQTLAALSSQGLPIETLTAREYHLTTSLSAVRLLEELRHRKVTAEEVTRAFLRRAVVAHQATNCLTELPWDEAIERAKFLDSLPEPLGPLHGLPISIKKHQGMHIYQKSTNTAYVAWIGSPSLYSPLNQALWDVGCVFYDCNPWNRNLSSGGSSGGEGALIGIRRSVLSVGGDIGGSVRAPAAANSLYGLKPTANRLGVAGMKATMAGNEGIHATYGPLSTDRESIELFMNVVLDAQLWKQDPALDSKLWQSVEVIKPLKVAVMWSDGVVQPQPAITRALTGVVERCRQHGMHMIDWDPVDHDQAWDLYVSLLYPDGGADARRPLQEAGEPVLPLINWITSEQRESKMRSIHEYWALVCQRENYRAEYARRWNATAHAGHGQREVDVILCPAGPGVAPIHDTARYWSYTSQWNLLDYPAIVFPTGVFVDLSIDPKDEQYQPLNDQDEYHHNLYDPETYIGAPVGLQLVARRALYASGFDRVKHNLAAGEDKLLATSDSSSEQYGKYMPREEVDKLFAPSHDTVSAVRAWLIDHVINKTVVGHTNIPASDAESILSSELYEYEDTRSEKTRLSCDQYHVPTYLTKQIDSITPRVQISAVLKKSEISAKVKVGPHIINLTWHYPLPPTASGLPPELANSASRILISILSSLWSIHNPALSIRLMMPTYARKEVAVDNTFNTFPDALDGSYCKYTGYGMTGNSLDIDPTYPDSTSNVYKSQLQCECGQANSSHICLLWRVRERFPEELCAPSVQRVHENGPPGPYNLCVKLRLWRQQRTCRSDSKCLLIQNQTKPRLCKWVPLEYDSRRNSAVSGGFSNYFAIASYQRSAIEEPFAKLDPGHPYYTVNANASNIGAEGGIFNRAGRGYPDVSANGAYMPAGVQQRHSWKVL
ncbi:hypothetical protein AC579_5039 [Pseudocercospora musae]|uniref:amidase n=1 Tax=Pseudocercospora musae TaxID=113226 RepID=A0A139IAR6_9PEZI|nr:hypothetical protein AC579_5039 [Pseudocercospora musae]